MKSDKCVIIGGDSRRVYMEEYLNLQGIATVVYETDTPAAIDELRKDGVTVILPLPASRDGENININLHCEQMSFDNLVSMLKTGDRVFAGMLCDTLEEKFSDRGIKVIDYYDEELIVENARLTAIGLMNVFYDNGIDLASHRTLITGFGRTAKAIAQSFESMNVDFTVVARSDEAISLAKSMNFKAVRFNDFTDKWAEFGLIINTVPAVIFDETVLERLCDDCIITDIASYPYGVDIKQAQEHGVKVIRALSLPGRYTPALAGNAIGERIKCLL